MYVLGRAEEALTPTGLIFGKTVYLEKTTHHPPGVEFIFPYQLKRL